MSLPKLDFPNVDFGKQSTPWNLNSWLFKGGAGTNQRKVQERIESGRLGSVKTERVPLVCRIHRELSSSLDLGASRHTVDRQLKDLRLLFNWADRTNFQLNIGSIEEGYRLWTDSLINRVRIAKSIAPATAYGYAKSAGSVLDRVLARAVPIVSTTRLRRRRGGGASTVTAKAEKQNLQETFAFGHLLLDISDALSTEAIWGSLPVRIRVRDGKDVEDWAGCRFGTPSRYKPSQKHVAQARQAANRAAKNFESYEADKSLRTRYTLVNLRIQAEMFMLMGQPGINLAQAYKLRMDQWRFKPSTNGYEVRSYKSRRLGPVQFEIYSLYRPILERYIRWRSEIFPNDPDGLLFPLVGRMGASLARHPSTPPSFQRLQTTCSKAGIRYLPPSALRNTNANWMLRRSQDPELTAEEKQHSAATLLHTYERRSLQRALTQSAIYWAKNDPVHAAAAPGACKGSKPEPIADIPDTATKPDCITPAGCIFCKHLRDIDSFDHVWSLASYRQLKTFELSGQAPALSQKAIAEHPAELVIQRITDKFTSMKAASATRQGWIHEASIRIEEGRYHPAWAKLIEML